MDVEKTIREYLPQVIHLSLATCIDNKPWVCEVHYVYDAELNLYFRSKPSRRHSEEIAKNPNVAGNIVAQHVLDEKVMGVYFEGVTQMLTDVDKDHIAYKLCCERFGKDVSILEELKDVGGHGFYKITVKEWSVFDGRGPGPSGKHVLPWKK